MPGPDFFVVDRIEGTVAVVIADDGRSFDVPRQQLPKGVREGSVLRLPTGGGEPDWKRAALDDAERDRRMREARSTLEKLKKTDPGGDIQL